MLGVVSVVVIRFWWTLYPALGFLGFIGFRIIQSTLVHGGHSVYDVLSPTLLATGLLLMHYGRNTIITSEGDTITSWSFQFWTGEALVICIFTYNTFKISATNPYYAGGLIVLSGLFALLFRGRFWNYVTILGLIAVLGIFIALAFPMMELLIETVLNEKLKLVGEKVRHHHFIMKHHYEKKLQESIRKK